MMLERPIHLRVRRTSCQKNSRERTNGVRCLISHRTTFVHWLSFSGRSRWLRIHCAKYGYMAVSDVGRMATGPFSSGASPLCVTHATSGAKSCRHC
jgi:hypothetical protein